MSVLSEKHRSAVRAPALVAATPATADLDYAEGVAYADTVAEVTSAAGVTVDGLLIKDGQIQGTAPILADTISEKTGAAGVTVDGVLLKDGGATVTGTLELSDGSTLLRKGVGTGTGEVVEVVGPDATHGLKVVVYEATVSPSAIETALLTVPAMSVVEAVQANVQTALTGGGTTVTFSVGITGDVDLYGTAGTAGAPADLLAQNSKLDCFGTRAANAGAGIGLWVAGTQAVKLIGAATGGATAGDTALTAGSVKVRIVYRSLMAMANA